MQLSRHLVSSPANRTGDHATTTRKSLSDAFFGGAREEILSRAISVSQHSHLPSSSSSSMKRMHPRKTTSSSSKSSRRACRRTPGGASTSTTVDSTLEAPTCHTLINSPSNSAGRQSSKSSRSLVSETSHRSMIPRASATSSCTSNRNGINVSNHVALKRSIKPLSVFAIDNAEDDILVNTFAPDESIHPYHWTSTTKLYSHSDHAGLSTRIRRSRSQEPSRNQVSSDTSWDGRSAQEGKDKDRTRSRSGSARRCHRSASTHREGESARPKNSFVSPRPRPSINHSVTKTASTSHQRCLSNINDADSNYPGQPHDDLEDNQDEEQMNASVQSDDINSLGYNNFEDNANHVCEGGDEKSYIVGEEMVPLNDEVLVSSFRDRSRSRSAGTKQNQTDSVLSRSVSPTSRRPSHAYKNDCKSSPRPQGQGRNKDTHSVASSRKNTVSPGTRRRHRSKSRDSLQRIISAQPTYRPSSPAQSSGGNKNRGMDNGRGSSSSPGGSIGLRSRMMAIHEVSLAKDASFSLQKSKDDDSNDIVAGAVGASSVSPGTRRRHACPYVVVASLNDEPGSTIGLWRRSRSQDPETVAWTDRSSSLGPSRRRQPTKSRNTPPTDFSLGMDPPELRRSKSQEFRLER